MRGVKGDFQALFCENSRVKLPCSTVRHLILGILLISIFFDNFCKQSQYGKYARKAFPSTSLCK